jgi:hypothetical protein
MWVDGANPNTPKPPPSHSWGRFSAHISQIKQKVLKGYRALNKGIVGASSNVLGKNKAFLKLKYLLWELSERLFF